MKDEVTLPLTQDPGLRDRWAQNEYAACHRRGFGFAAQRHPPNDGQVWLYRLGPKLFAVVLVPDFSEPRRLITSWGARGLDWTKSLADDARQSIAANR